MENTITPQLRIDRVTLQSSTGEMFDVVVDALNDDASVVAAIQMLRDERFWDTNQYILKQLTSIR